MFYVTFLLYPLNFHESPKYEQSGTVGRKVQIYIFIYEWFIFIKISLIKIGEINPMQILTLLLLIFFKKPIIGRENSCMRRSHTILTRLKESRFKF